MINYYICCKKTKEESNELSDVHRWNITFYLFQNDLFTTEESRSILVYQDEESNVFYFFSEILMWTFVILFFFLIFK